MEQYFNILSYPSVVIRLKFPPSHHGTVGTCLFLSMQMATVERNAGCTEGEQKETMSPPKEDSPPVLNDTTAPLNFSELTPCQFGISVKSFTPASLSNCKGERTGPYMILKLLLHSLCLPQTEVCTLCLYLSVLSLSHHFSLSLPLVAQGLL